MGMLAGTNHDSIELFLNFIELTKIGEAFCLRKLPLCSVQRILRHIAQRNNVLRSADLRQVAPTSATGPNDSDVQFAIKILASKESWRCKRAHSGTRK